MSITKLALAGAAALTLIGVAGAASAAPWDHNQSRYDYRFERQDHRVWQERHDRELRRLERERELRFMRDHSRHEFHGRFDG